MRKYLHAALAVGLLLSLGWLRSASAHARLVSSDPPAGARLTSAPANVTLRFSEEISDKATDSFFTVADAQGGEVGRGTLDNTDIDHTTLSGALKPGLGNGVYTVTWQTITPDDNGKSEGSFRFGVNADPGAQPTAAAHEQQPTAGATARPAATAQATRVTGAAAAQPTAPAAANPSSLPKTGESGSDASGYLLLAAAVLLVGGLVLLRDRWRAR